MNMLTLTTFRLLIHQRNRHDYVIGDREAHLKVGAESELHAQKHGTEDSQELGVSASL